MRDGFQIREQLSDGRLTIYLKPKSEIVSAGSKYRFPISLYDDSMAEAVGSEEIDIVIKEAAAPPPKKKIPPGPRPKPTPKNKGKGKGKGKSKNPPTLGLPPCTILTNDGRTIKGEATEKWPEDLNFDEIDGGLVEELGDDQIVYKINWDNSYHLEYRRQAKGRVAEQVITEKYILGMRVLMLGLEQAYRQLKTKLKDEESAAGLQEYVDVFRRMASQGAASTVLALAQNLPKIVDKSATTIDDA